MIGSTIPTAVVIATIAEPVATRIIAATQPNRISEISKDVVKLATASPIPPVINTFLNAPPAPIIKIMDAGGARQADMNWFSVTLLIPLA